jgi:hypothetical protein
MLDMTMRECRREWKRIGVPDPVANEMAADLAADVEEADADGVSAEEVLTHSPAPIKLRGARGCRATASRRSGAFPPRP